MQITYINKEKINLNNIQQAADQFNIIADELLIEPQKIDKTPWPDYKTTVKTSFIIAHTDDYILLKFTTTEPQILATHKTINSNVYEDSCVEFFISTDNKQNYYNFEFNPNATILAQYGPNRTNREFLTIPQIEQIKRTATINKKENTWSLFTAIPKSILKDIDNKCYINLYKCGDKLKQPHYLTWNLIKTKTPDFHRPEFFKTVILS